MASLTINIDVVRQGGIVRYWLGSRLLYYVDLTRGVAVDMLDRKVKTIMRAEQ